MRWVAGENQVTFEVGLNAGEGKTVTICFQPSVDGGFAGENWRYQAKTMLRRYLSELRDNYIMRKPSPGPR